MKKHVILAATVSVVSLAIAGSTAFAIAPYATKARSYRASLVRAMDKCDPATISVFVSGDPPGGCLQANIVTDDVPPGSPTGATFKFGRLVVTRYPGKGGQGRIRVSANGLQPGQRVRVGLTLRTTHIATSVKHLPGPGTNKSVTFEDTMVECGTDLPSLPCFTARPNGRLAGVMTLAQCLTDNSAGTGLAKGNVEIIDSSFINCDTHKVFARPGIVN
jgi:hypothetical protein